MRVALLVGVTVLGSQVWPVLAADAPAVARARVLYNAGAHDAAIAAALEASGDSGPGSEASLVLARAYLERYRMGGVADDLVAARVALRAVQPAALDPRDQVDLLVGLGQSLFFEGLFGPAAEMFEGALGRASLLPAAGQGLLLDWWASALEREAQARPADARTRVFDRISARMRQTLRDDPASVPANYWLPAALRGAGDLDDAWDAAIAAWVRTAVYPGAAPALRADLDRLVMDGLIPDRAQQTAAAARKDTVAALAREWELVKAQWP